MKKLVLTCIVAVIFLSGCSYRESVENHKAEENPLVLVESYARSMDGITPRTEIYYHKDTKVMYMVIIDGVTGITPLLNSDGSPMLWNGEQ